MKSNARMAAITAEAEQSFANYAGPDASELVGVQDAAYGNMSGAAPMIDVESSVRDLIVTIENTDELNTLICPLFSANERIAVPFDGVADKDGTAATAAKGLIVDWDDYSGQEIIDMCKNEPFVIAGVRYDYGDNVQLKQKMERRSKVQADITYGPVRFRKNLGDSIDGVLEDPNFTLKVDGGTTFFVKVAPAYSATSSRIVQLQFKIATSVNISNALQGRSAIKKFGPQFAQNQNVRVF